MQRNEEVFEEQDLNEAIKPLHSSRMSKIKFGLQTCKKSEDRENTISFDLKNCPLQQNLDLECQKLRESYGAHRKQRNSKSRGKSGGKAGNHSISPDRLHPNFALTELKENNCFNSLNIIPTNKFKRPNIQESTYSNKYQKLEENFKKFTKSIQEKRNSSKSPVNKTASTLANTHTTYPKQTVVSSSTPQFQKEEIISDRRLAMRIMLSSVQNFFNSSFSKLQKLAVSKTQEKQILMIQSDIEYELSQAADSPEEVMTLQTTFEKILERIQTVFGQILTRIYQVDSTTFLNYKFKNLIGLMQHLLEESYRLQCAELMPQLIQTIQTHKTQAGLYILNGFQRRQEKQILSKKFQLWHSNSTKARKMIDKCKKMVARQSIKKIARSFWLWAFNPSSLTKPSSFIIKLMLDASLFQNCIQSEAGLSKTVCQTLKNDLNLDCDLIFVNNEHVSVLDQETGNVSKFNPESLKNSVTMDCFEKAEPIKLISSLFASRQFQENIDHPFLSQETLKTFKFDVGMIVIPLVLDGPLKKVFALLRVFSSQQKLKNFESKELLQMSQQVSSFIARVQGLRLTLEFLTSQLQEKSDQVKIAELEQTVHKCLFGILDDLHSGTKQDFLELVKLRTEILLKQLLQQDDTFYIREILYKTKDEMSGNLIRTVEIGLLLDPTKKQSLIRKRDHKKEQSDLLLDYLDYQSDLLVQQISLDIPTFTIILHKQMAFETKRENNVNSNFNHALRLLGRCLEPILLQGLKIHEDLAKKVQKQSSLLYRQVLVDKAKTICRARLHKFSYQTNDHAGYQKLLECLQECFLLIQDTKVQQAALLLNTSVLTGEQSCQKLFGYLTESQMQLMQVPDTLQESKWMDVSRIDVLSTDFQTCAQEFTVSDEEITVKLPMVAQNLLLAILKVQFRFTSNTKDYQDLKFFLSSLSDELNLILEQTLEEAKQNRHFGECFNQLKRQNQSLTLDIDFMQAVQQQLVIPFTKTPCLRTLGVSITELALKVLPLEVSVNCIQLIKESRIISQDIRCQVYGDFGIAIRMSCPVELNQGIISIKFESSKLSSIVIILSFEGSDQTEFCTQMIQQCEVFHLILQAFVKTALNSLTNALLPVHKVHLPRTITKIAMQRKYGYIYNFFSSLKDMKVNQVPIFTRLNCFRHIIKVKPIASNLYIEQPKRYFEQKKHVINILAHTFKRLNEFGSRVKQATFDRFRINVLQILHNEEETLRYTTKYLPTKLQRKSVCMIQRIRGHLMQRAYFCKLAILSQQYKNLNNPQNKLLGAVLCMNYNFVRMLERIALQKMRSNAANQQYRDFNGIKFKDREIMLSLQRQLFTEGAQLNIQEQNQDLESQFTFVIEQAMTYLQESILPESLDVIVFSIQQPGGNRARAYVFNNKMSDDSDDVLRLGYRDVIDTSDNMALITESLKGLKDFTMRFDTDVILLMMNKSKQMFNFKDISTSLYQTYLKQLGNSSSEDTASRMMLIKKSRSALLCPLVLRTLDEGLVGSIELFRFNGQPFDTEFEQRMAVFNEQFVNVLQVYLNIRQTRSQLQQMQQQMTQTCKVPSSLTSLLRQMQNVTPQIIGVPHVLCLILNQDLAYFYQFQDNFIYNFKFTGTFIEEVIDYQCVLELTFTESDSTPYSQESGSFGFETFKQELTTHKRRSVQSLKSVTNISGFKHIYYYPVIGEGNVIAIIEVGYTQNDQVPKVVMNETIVALSTQFSSQLTQYTNRMRSFCRQTQGLLNKWSQVSKAKSFFEWKYQTQIMIQKSEFQHNQKQVVQQTEECFKEYVKSLESYDGELRKLVEEKQFLTQETQSLKRDKITKYKLLGASLILNMHMEKQQRRQTFKKAFNKWKHFNSITKIAESAFNKMLELNYRHCDKRFEVAAYLLKKTLIRRTKKCSFDNILSFSRITQLKMGANGSNYSSCKLGHTATSALNTSGRLANDAFSNIIGPFQKSHMNTRTILSSTNTKNNNSLSLTPTITNLNFQTTVNQPNEFHATTHLQQLHEQLGFGCVPKGLSERENGARNKRKSSRSKSGERKTPIVKKMAIN